MGGFVWGCILGAVVVYSTVGERVEVQEVLPENYSIVTSISDNLCSGPTGRENIVHTRVRTQTVQLQ
jgi:hypothetical protein